jgi:predicted RNase H-like HicB family nuclease
MRSRRRAWAEESAREGMPNQVLQRKPCGSEACRRMVKKAERRPGGKGKPANQRMQRSRRSGGCGGSPVPLAGTVMPTLDAARLSCYIIGAEEFGMKYRVLIEQDEDAIYVAEVPSLPGCISQGQTRAEVLDNIKEAIAAYLESLEDHNEPIPPPISEEIVEVST